MIFHIFGSLAEVLGVSRTRLYATSGPNLWRGPQPLRGSPRKNASGQGLPSETACRGRGEHLHPPRSTRLAPQPVAGREISLLPWGVAWPPEKGWKAALRAGSDDLR